MNYITIHKMYKQAAAENLSASLGQGRGLGPGLGRIDGTGLYAQDLSESDRELQYLASMGARDPKKVRNTLKYSAPLSTASESLGSAAVAGAIGGGAALLFNAMGGDFDVERSAIGSAALGGGIALLTSMVANSQGKEEGRNAYPSNDDITHTLRNFKASRYMTPGEGPYLREVLRNSRELHETLARARASDFPKK